LAYEFVTIIATKDVKAVSVHREFVENNVD